MDALDQSYTDTKKLSTGFNSVIKSVMELLEPDFIEANKDQMLAGLDSVGGNMPEHRGGWYMAYKQRKGSKSIPFMDYKNTGKFHSSLRAISDNEGTEIFSTDGKAIDLEKRISANELYGVTESNLEKIRPKAIELLQDEIRNALGL